MMIEAYSLRAQINPQTLSSSFASNKIKNKKQQKQKPLAVDVDKDSMHQKIASFRYGMQKS